MTLWEWFWRSSALRSARANRTAHAGRAFAQRARIAFEIGKHTLAPSGPWLAGDASHIASALFVESIGWSLQALDAAEPDAPQGSPEAAQPPSGERLARLLDAHEHVLLDAARGPRRLSELHRHALERDFEHLALEPQEAERIALALAETAQQLLRQAPSLYSELERVTLQRVLRVSLLALFVVTMVSAFFVLRERLERQRDLAAGKPWLASSTYEPACVSPSHQCGERDFFFHTHDEASPWLEVDLMRPERVGSVKVWNRGDCCAERAVPLVVEVSSDRKTWREVRRRDTLFDTWRASFTPTTARWVRFRVARHSSLHLQDLRILP